MSERGRTALEDCSAANTGDTAPSPRQDARFGRDAAAKAGALTKTGGGAAGFDFTPLDTSGNTITLTGTPPVPSVTPACVRDNVTGLIWEVKTNDGGLRDKDWTYTWYNGTTGTPDGTNNCNPNTRCDTDKFVADVNTAGSAAPPAGACPPAGNCSPSSTWVPNSDHRRQLLPIRLTVGIGPAISTRPIRPAPGSWISAVAHLRPLPGLLRRPRSSCVADSDLTLLR